MAISRLEYLFDCYVHNNCSEKEKEELMALLVLPENKDTVLLLIEKTIQQTGPEIKMKHDAADTMLQRILANNSSTVLPAQQRQKQYAIWVPIVVVILLVLIGTAYLQCGGKNHVQKKSAVQK